MGTWVVPYKTEQAEKIRQLMMEPFPAGIHSASDTFYNLIGDDNLFDSLMELGHDEDCRVTVLTFLQKWFGVTGGDHDLQKSWGWSGQFEDGALAIFNDMLTEWAVYNRFPSRETEDGTIIMSPHELASHVEGYLKDLAGDCPEEAAKIFEHVFPSATVLFEHGTFTVDMDGKTDLHLRKR